MSKRKGVSADEKRQRTLDFFNETQTCYTLKELEKLLPKQKGVISQAVKDVVQELVNDDLVDQDKCGTQTLYWALPSKTIAKRKQRIAALEKQLAETKSKIAVLEARKKESMQGREDTAERATKLAQLQTCEKTNHELKTELSKYSDFDPDTLADLEKKTLVCIQAANRWTDNLYELCSYFATKTNRTRGEIHDALGVPEDMEYL